MTVQELKDELFSDQSERAREAVEELAVRTDTILALPNTPMRRPRGRPRKHPAGAPRPRKKGTPPGRIYWTDDERKRCEQAAEAAKMSTSAWLRAAALAYLAAGDGP